MRRSSEHEIADAQQGVDDADVGGVAASVEQSAWTTGELGKRFLKFLVSGGMAADEMRCAGTRTPTVDAAFEGVGDTRIPGESQVVVAAEVDERATVDQHLPTLRALQAATGAKHVPATEVVETTLKIVESLAVAHGLWCSGRGRCAE